MNTTNSKFERETLTVLLRRSETEATMVWLGESDSRNPGEFLNPIVKQFATELPGIPVTIDLTKLSYMNSATVAPLIACIKSLDSSAAEVHVRFSDADWQRTHVQCLRAISRKMKGVHIEVIASGSSPNR